MLTVDATHDSRAMCGLHWTSATSHFDMWGRILGMSQGSSRSMTTRPCRLCVCVCVCVLIPVSCSKSVLQVTLPKQRLCKQDWYSCCLLNGEIWSPVHGRMCPLAGCRPSWSHFAQAASLPWWWRWIYSAVVPSASFSFDVAVLSESLPGCFSVDSSRICVAWAMDHLKMHCLFETW